MARPKKATSFQSEPSPDTANKPKAKELVAQALKNLGENAPNANLQAYIMENYGRKVPITYISHLKGIILGKASESAAAQSEKSSADASPPSTPARVSTARSSPTRATPSLSTPSLPTNDDRFLEDIRTLLQIKQRLGAKRFSQLAQLVCFDESPDA